MDGFDIKKNEAYVQIMQIIVKSQVGEIWQDAA